jgi:hypothetical protein
MSEILLAVVGAILSLVFTYVPALKEWLDAHPQKGLLMLAFVAIIAVAYFGLSCTPLAAQLGISVTCDQAGAIELVKAWFAIAAGNQLAFLYTRK